MSLYKIYDTNFLFDNKLRIDFPSQRSLHFIIQCYKIHTKNATINVNKKCTFLS